jgi:hypothetical protein
MQVHVSHNIRLEVRVDERDGDNRYVYHDDRGLPFILEHAGFSRYHGFEEAKTTVGIRGSAIKVDGTKGLVDRTASVKFTDLPPAVQEAILAELEGWGEECASAQGIRNAWLKEMGEPVVPA